MIYADQEIPISISLSAVDNHSFYNPFASVKARIGKNDQSYSRFTNEKGEDSFRSDIKNNYASINENVTAIAPGGSEGDILEIGFTLYFGVDLETWYVYEWQMVEGAALETEQTTPTSERATPEPYTESPPAGAQEADIPWITIIGGLGAVAAGGLATAATAIGVATRAKRRRSRQKEKEPDQRDGDEERDERPIAYILQLSRDRLELKPGSPVSLQIAVWQVDEEGNYAPASGAQVRVFPPPGVTAAPTGGGMRLITRIEQLDGPAAGEKVLRVEAIAGGGRYTAEVVLALEGEYRIEYF